MLQARTKINEDRITYILSLLEYVVLNLKTDYTCRFTENRVMHGGSLPPISTREKSLTI